MHAPHSQSQLSISVGPPKDSGPGIRLIIDSCSIVHETIITHGTKSWYISSQTLQKANMTAAASKQKSKGPPVINMVYNKVRQGKAESGYLTADIPPIHRSLGKSSHRSQI
jgi:hypothetical protein